ncbi:response regulator transcription factor [Gemmobacter serpentinus]|uniref:response regulator transcription factor n=1 Tax=Gemmobacter serpentinus TaxID=2652247 RepID=UPI00124F46F0|nr:response regulator transcription factor [Gemmobacter serpentinus]
MKVLVVDDDPRLREVVTIALGRAGFTTLTASDGQSALMHNAREVPDLIVLDIGLPEMDGLEVCRRIRHVSEVPILFLTARDDEVDRILGLELGADDYVTKPFSPRELVARVRAILKRSTGGGSERPLRHGRITLDRSRHSCRVDDAAVDLTATEMGLLSELMRAPERVLTRSQLTDALWGVGSPVSDRTLDSHLRNLRRKLALAGASEALRTVHGVGIGMGAT